jgi:aspartyl-tRNA(Asn)/glutamyl-tRNA(Gln) amidotransferase subunit A
MPIRELQTLVQTQQVSPVELAETFLARLETLGPQYNAVVTVTRERALQQARQAERDIAAGHYKGPLHGIPYGAKDLLATSGGIPTTWGAAPLRHQKFEYDATVVRQLAAANCPGGEARHGRAAVAWAIASPMRPSHGPGINPWDRTTGVVGRPAALALR